jgi:hypothetical protein
MIYKQILMAAVVALVFLAVACVLKIYFNTPPADLSPEFSAGLMFFSVVIVVAMSIIVVTVFKELFNSIKKKR